MPFLLKTLTCVLISLIFSDKVVLSSVMTRDSYFGSLSRKISSIGGFFGMPANNNEPVISSNNVKPLEKKEDLVMVKISPTLQQKKNLHEPMNSLEEPATKQALNVSTGKTSPEDSSSSENLTRYSSLENSSNKSTQETSIEASSEEFSEEMKLRVFSKKPTAEDEDFVRIIKENFPNNMTQQLFDYFTSVEDKNNNFDKILNSFKGELKKDKDNTILYCRSIQKFLNQSRHLQGSIYYTKLEDFVTLIIAVSDYRRVRNKYFSNRNALFNPKCIPKTPTIEILEFVREFCSRSSGSSAISYFLSKRLEVLSLKAKFCIDNSVKKAIKEKIRASKIMQLTCDYYVSLDKGNNDPDVWFEEKDESGYRRRYLKDFISGFNYEITHKLTYVNFEKLVLKYHFYGKILMVLLEGMSTKDENTKVQLRNFHKLANFLYSMIGLFDFKMSREISANDAFLNLNIFEDNMRKSYLKFLSAYHILAQVRKLDLNIDSIETFILAVEQKFKSVTLEFKEFNFSKLSEVWSKNRNFITKDQQQDFVVVLMHIAIKSYQGHHYFHD